MTDPTFSEIVPGYESPLTVEETTVDTPSEETRNDGASVTEGWADTDGNPAHPQTDFIEDERSALGIGEHKDIPDDQKKVYPYVAVFAITMCALTIAALLLFVNLI